MTDGALRHPFLRRLPLLLLVGAGMLLWRSGLFPQPRTLVWDVPPDLAVTRAEVQLWQGPALVARAEWPSPPRGGLVQHLQLRSGDYRALLFLALADGGTAGDTRTVEVREETVHIATSPR